MIITERIENLRQLMKAHDIAAYIIPSSDAHLSEYVSDHYKSREWISGFTGSAGTVVITLTDAGLWTDGRYYIQAENQINGTGIQLFRMMDPGVLSYPEWLNQILADGDCIGFDGHVFSVEMVRSLEKVLAKKRISYNMDHDLIGELWSKRPALPSSPVFIHELQYAGRSRVEKINDVRSEMKKLGANFFLLTSLDDIAWLLNIRGADVPNNPVTISNVIVTNSDCILFIDPAKVSVEVKSQLEKDNIRLLDYSETEDFLKRLSEDDTVLLDPEMTNAILDGAIFSSKASKIESENVTTKLKAIKNPIEIKNLKQCQESDGAAMVRFIKWLKTSLGKERITEISLAEKLEYFRKLNELYMEPSFDTIAGYKEHGAMMHYKATKETDYALESKGFLLVDSGGQYYNGTTDITRTIVLGQLTAEEKRDFTLVLKGHIALSMAKFLHGTTGQSIDILARQPLWRYGLDYKCGTGHGVGFCLNVHEGPQRISQTPNTVVLEEGMNITNEPGIYREGQYGIRTENMMLVVSDDATNCGQFLKFETITYCPIDLEGIDRDLLTVEEIQWLNDYHKEVYERLSPYLNGEENAWLKQETKGI